MAQYSEGNILGFGHAKLTPPFNEDKYVNNYKFTVCVVDFSYLDAVFHTSVSLLML